MGENAVFTNGMKLEKPFFPPPLQTCPRTPSHSTFKKCTTGWVLQRPGDLTLSFHLVRSIKKAGETYHPFTCIDMPKNTIILPSIKTHITVWGPKVA